MVGENGLGASNPLAPALAFLTSDDGQAWVNISSSFPSGSYPMVAASCPTSNTCYAAGLGVGAVTTDGGQSWVSIQMPNGVSDDLYGQDDGEGFQDLSCASASMCVFVGSNSSGPATAVTTNSATAWTQSLIG
jgi:hypothetical protein